jgi:hypothetical protein
MNGTRLSRITLPGVLLLGVAFGLHGLRESRRSVEEAQIPTEEAATAAKEALPPASAASRDSAASTSSSAAYAAAWELLKDGKLRRGERQVLECMLMEEWCRADLRAALHAALEEDWTTIDNPLPPEIFHVYAAEVGLQLDLVWELISSWEYGLQTHKLRSLWISACARNRPLELVRRLPELPANSRHKAISSAAYATHRGDDPTPGSEEVITAVLALRGTPDEAVAKQALSGGLSGAMDFSELVAKMENTPDPEFREVYLAAYVHKLDHSHPRHHQDSLDSLPADLRAEVMSRLAPDQSGPGELPLSPEK